MGKTKTTKSRSSALVRAEHGGAAVHLTKAQRGVLDEAQARTVLASFERSRIAELMLGILVQAPTSSPMIHEILWDFGVPEGDYRDILDDLLVRGAIEDSGGEDTSILFGLTKPMIAAMREDRRWRARLDLSAADRRKKPKRPSRGSGRKPKQK